MHAAAMMAAARADAAATRRAAGAPLVTRVRLRRNGQRPERALTLRKSSCNVAAPS